MAFGRGNNSAGNNEAFAWDINSGFTGLWWKVAEWPLVGKRVYSAWSRAASDLPAIREKYRPQLAQFSRTLVSSVAKTAAGILAFLVSLIIAGIMLAYAESGSRAMLRVVNRLTGPARGVHVHALATATIRSVEALSSGCRK